MPVAVRSFRIGRGAWRTVSASSVALAVLAALVCSAAPPRASGAPPGSEWRRADLGAGALRAQWFVNDSARADAQGSLIRYYNAAPLSAAVVARALRAWNQAAVGAHFVAVRRRDAQVVIRAAGPRAGCNGLAAIRGSVVSSNRDVPIRYGYGASAVVKLGENCPVLEVRALIAAHELGHVLGLHHQRHRCSVMEPSVDARNGSLVRPAVCSPGAWDGLLRRLVAAGDVRAARALYRDRATRADTSSSGPTGSGFGPLWLWGAVVLGAMLIGLRRVSRR